MDNFTVQHNQNSFADTHLQSVAEHVNLQSQFKEKRIAVIGFGVTGKACAEYLLSLNANIDIYDKTLDLTSIESFISGKNVDISFYQICQSLDLTNYDFVVVSPGVNLNQPFIKHFITAKPTSLLGEIELFCQAFNTINRQKVINAEPTIKLVAVTGSNGKSTVVDLLSKSLSACGIKTGLGGNFGTPALSLIDTSYDVIVLELSSFQLESTQSLNADIACILNVTADHLDRHGSLQRYADIKRTIYNNATNIVFNKDDTLTHPLSMNSDDGQIIEISKFSSITHASMPKLVSYDGNTIFYNNLPFLSKSELVEANLLANTTDFQMFNIQVVLVCAHLLKSDIEIVKQSIVNYRGLSHRFEVVRCMTRPFTYLAENEQLTNNNIHVIKWINDSKATNPGAAVAAIRSLHNQSQTNQYIILIAGGDAKGADIASSDMIALTSAIKECVDSLLLLGKDADLFTSMHSNNHKLNTLKEAVNSAYQQILSNSFEQPTDVIVLLSPACASLDMFDNYQQRGIAFVEAVNEVGESCSN